MMKDKIALNEPEFCAKISKYLAAMSTDLLEIEHSILHADHLNGATLSKQEQISIQKIDHVYQRLTDLSLLFKGFSESVENTRSFSSKLALEETRALLDSGKARGLKTYGDLDLF